MLSRLIAQSAARPLLARTTASAGMRRPVPAAAAILAARTWTRGMAKNNKPESRFSSPQKPQRSWPSQGGAPSSKAPAPPPSSAPESAPSSSDPEYAAPKSAQPEASEKETTPESAEKETQIPEQQIRFDQLPDLTQGLPSTLEYETGGAKSASQMALQGVSPSGGGRGKGELPASAYVSSADRRRMAMAKWMYTLMAGGFVAGVVMLGRNWEDEEVSLHPDVPNGWGPILWWNRAYARLGDVLNYYQEPAQEKLLPDPQEPFQRPYTLCISLEDMLVHSEWTREHGWRLAKRPGMDYFIRYLQQYYEIVLFTTVPFGFGEQLWRKVEPYHIVYFALWREQTKYKDGKIVKDLSYLNRDLSKTIIIDTNPDSVSAQPENAIVLPKWKGDPQDRDLVSLIPFLEYIATVNTPDTREVLKSFEGKKIPEEFARREALARKRFQEKLAAERAKHRVGGSGGGAFGGLGGLIGLKPSKMSNMVSPDGEENVVEALAQGKMLQDIARERGQRNYEFLDKQIREHGAEWLKEEKEQMDKAQAEAVAAVKNDIGSWFGVAGKKPEAAPPAEKTADDKRKES